MGHAIGDRVPDVTLWRATDTGPVEVRSGEVLGQGRVVLIGVPGAFTPGCSKRHLPTFAGRAAELAGRGVDVIACVAVNDAWVLDAWAREQGVEDDIVMLSDGNAELTRALDLENDLSGIGLGLRSRRFAAVLEDGVIVSLEVDEPGQVTATTCDAVLSRL